MANNVFANGREVACKAADGKSICAFPDVCFTPPQTPATPPGVPLPYPNTAVASDAVEGSKSVTISGKEVMLKDTSCLKTSTGNEAGSAPKKGVATSQTKGKAYFTSWSMGVKIEGENVVRHLDLTTHNHNAKLSNTPTMPYVDSAAAGTQRPEQCDHVWEIRKPEMAYTAEQKKARLRKGGAADVFEAAGADHNKVTDGDDMSGANEKSKVFFWCKKCNTRGNEVDHVLRDENGEISAVVECKTGTVNRDQVLAQQGMTAQMGVGLVYKLRSGGRASETAAILQNDYGFSAANVIIV